MKPVRLHVLLLTASIILLAHFDVANGSLSFKNIKDKINKGKNFANELLGENGEIPRGNGCSVTWNIQGTIRGIKWKWICTCTDKCTGITEVQTKSSRDGAMEHCLTHLFKKLGQRGEL